MAARNDTIAAVATGVGGAIAVIRISGPDAITICDTVIRTTSGRKLADAKGYTLHYGEITDKDGNSVDDVIVSLFRAPKSYTGEDMVEISCHGSRYIQQRIITLLLDAGARNAEAGEFTIRAFLAGKMDLSQAEAVADMIASTDKATHALALNQMRGGYSDEFGRLRERLLNIASLLELELDFSEEEVEFADRSQLSALTEEIKSKIARLLDSFRQGNAIKEGIAVAIVGEPNVGKSTLLNTLLQDDRAMVSDIAGTTRDVIEESINIRGVRFRFIDTAGIRHTDDALEKMGIERTFASIDKADIILLLVEPTDDPETTMAKIDEAVAAITIQEHQKLCVLLNKADKHGLDSAGHTITTIGTTSGRHTPTVPQAIIPISAKKGRNIDRILDFLYETSHVEEVYKGDAIVSNSRHYEALSRAYDAISRVGDGIAQDIPSDFIAQDIRETLHYLGMITGKITTDEILGNIFSKFCIGK